MDSTFGGRVPQGNLLWIGRQLSLSASFLWEQWSETLPMAPMGRRGYKPISLQPPYPLPPSPSLLCIGSRMGPAEEGSPPYERERVTCMFISAACVLGSPPRSMPSGEGVWWLTSKSFQPPLLAPFFLKSWLISTWGRCPWREVGTRAASNQIILEQVPFLPGPFWTGHLGISLVR